MPDTVARERRREGARALRIEIANRPQGDSGAEGALPPIEWRMRLEDEIRRAAFLCVDALQQGACVKVVADKVRGEGPRFVAVRPGPQAADRVLGFLARLPPEAPLPDDSTLPRTGSSVAPTLPRTSHPLVTRARRPATVPRTA